MLIARSVFGDAVTYGEVRDDRFHVIRGDVFGEYELTGQSFPCDEVVLTTPVQAGRLFAVMGGFLPPGVAFLDPPTGRRRNLHLAEHPRAGARDLMFRCPQHQHSRAKLSSRHSAST